MADIIDALGRRARSPAPSRPGGPLLVCRVCQRPITSGRYLDPRAPGTVSAPVGHRVDPNHTAALDVERMGPASLYRVRIDLKFKKMRA